MDMDMTPLKIKLSQQGRTNRWLAKMVNMDEVTLSLIVTGKRKPSIERAIKIARVLDTTVEELWGWTVDGVGDD